MMKEEGVEHAGKHIKMPLVRVMMAPHIPPAGRGRLPVVPEVSIAPEEKG